MTESVLTSEFAALGRGELGPAAAVLRDRLGRFESLDELIELHERIWWSVDPGCADAVDAVALVRTAAELAREAGVFPLLVAYVRAVCIQAWDLTWDHSAITAVLAELTAPRGAPPDDAERLAVGTLRLLAADLALETAATTGSYRHLAAVAADGVALCARLRDDAAALPPDVHTDYVAGLLAEDVPYYTATLRGAEAAAAFLDGEHHSDLDDAVAVVLRAEEDQSDEMVRSVLRGHRVALQRLAAARDEGWLRIDRGRIVYVYPFGLRGVPYDEVVAETKRTAEGWVLAGVALHNAPTQLLLVDDIWRGDDPLKRRYDGTQLDLPTLRRYGGRDDAGEPAADLELTVRVILSQLGNHQVRIELDLDAVGPHELAELTWLVAPEYGDLRELGLGFRFENEQNEQDDGDGGTFRWGRLADVARSIVLDLPGQLRRFDRLRVSARPGMYHVLTTVSRASALPGGRAADAVELESAEQIEELFGGQVLRHPIPSGVSTPGWWALCRPAGTVVDTAALVEARLVVTENHTFLASLHAPEYMINTVGAAVEFVAGLDGLFAAWQDDLGDFYQGLRDDVQQLADGVESGTQATREQLTASIEKLERSQLELRRFTTRARVSLLFVMSPALVTSPVMRSTIDRLLETRDVWTKRGEFTDVAEQVLGDRLNELMESWVRRQEQAEVAAGEAARQRSMRVAEAVTAAVTAIGLSGIVAIIQAGYSVRGWVAALLAGLVVMVALALGRIFWGLSGPGTDGERWHLRRAWRRPRRWTTSIAASWNRAFRRRSWTR